MDGETELCRRGFHFCRRMADVFNYYKRRDCRYAEVEVLGKVVTEGDKSVTDKLRMAKPFTMYDDWTSEGGWCAWIRKHIREIYNMLPEYIRGVIIPMNIRQIVRNEVVECEDPAFLLSLVNVFGKKERYPENNCGDTQIDIFQKAANHAKRRLGASGAAAWWLRSTNNGDLFSCVHVGSNDSGNYAYRDGGVVVAFCIEDKSPKG